LIIETVAVPLLSLLHIREVLVMEYMMVSPPKEHVSVTVNCARALAINAKEKIRSTNSLFKPAVFVV
jgi:hypothetical protein